MVIVFIWHKQPSCSVLYSLQLERVLVWGGGGKLSLQWPTTLPKNSHKTHGSSLSKRWLKIYSPTPCELSTITLNHLQCRDHSVILFAYNCVSCNNLELKPIWCFYLFTCAKALSSVQLYILHVYHNTTWGLYMCELSCISCTVCCY